MSEKYASERAAALIHQAIENNGADLKSFAVGIGAVMEHEGADAVAKTFDAIYRETEGDAKQLIPLLISAGSKNVSRSRRQKGSADAKSPLAKSHSPQRLRELTAAEILDAPPKGPVIAIPAEDSGSGRRRLLMRIGRRAFTWVGSFEQGNTESSAVELMPDGHLFVSARGAAYILDLQSHALIEKIGDDVMPVGRDDSGTLFIVSHGEQSLECFGTSGRLWRTPTLGSGGFRELAITGDELRGEARQPSEPEWTAFAVKLATGKVKDVTAAAKSSRSSPRRSR